MVRPKKTEQIGLQQAILETAWRLISVEGAAALSLRAIARELGITAPAIYNYYPRRDDLVTALIVDAFTDFGDAQFSAVERQPSDDHAGRLRAAGTVYRAWALQNPQRYQLIFGSPIPGYYAPAEVTTPAASRSLTALIGTLESARAAGKLKTSGQAALPAALREQLAVWRQFHEIGDEIVPYLALVVWSRVHGLVMLEIGGQFPPTIQDPGMIYTHELEKLVVDLVE